MLTPWKRIGVAQCNDEQRNEYYFDFFRKYGQKIVESFARVLLVEGDTK